MDSSQNLLIKDILTEVVKRGASDLHFSVGNCPVLRIEDDLVVLDDYQIITESFMEKFVKGILTEERLEKLSKEKEIIFSHDFNNNKFRFKINIFYQKGFLSASLRYIPFKIASLRELGLEDQMGDLVNLNSGLLIVSGSFGSGRSSTVAGVIEYINETQKKHIITIENPIEYIFNNKLSFIEQREVGRDTNSYFNALKYFQEADADILFLEDFNNPECIPLILEIASGNCLVIASMSADSVTKAISSILDNFNDIEQQRIRDLLATALKAIICQKKFPKIGGGSMVLLEKLLMTESVKATILNGNIRQIDNVIKTSRKSGMVSFEYSINQAVNKGFISKEVILRNLGSLSSAE